MFCPNFKDTPAGESGYRILVRRCNKSGLRAQRRKWLLLGGLRKMTQRRRKHFCCVWKSKVKFSQQGGSAPPDFSASENGIGDSHYWHYRHQNHIQKELCLPHVPASEGLFLGLPGFWSIFSWIDCNRHDVYYCITVRNVTMPSIGC